MRFVCVFPYLPEDDGENHGDSDKDGEGVVPGVVLREDERTRRKLRLVRDECEAHVVAHLNAVLLQLRLECVEWSRRIRRTLRGGANELRVLLETTTRQDE